jgi:hypothetical protein
MALSAPEPPSKASLGEDDVESAEEQLLGAEARASSRMPRALAAGLGLLMLATVGAVTLVARPDSRSGLTAAPAHAVSLYDELSTQLAGLPGIPLGKDTDPPVKEDPTQSANVMSAPMKDESPNEITVTCSDVEEKFMGACFKKCEILTNGTYPFRFAPNGCCKEMSVKCVLPSMRHMEGIFPGQGYEVDGKGNIPHWPGACDGNEEEHLGECFMKCSLLTDNEYMYRAAANTCCKKLPCWNIFNVKTVGGIGSGYGVGGGSPGHECPHSPSAMPR